MNVKFCILFALIAVAVSKSIDTNEISTERDELEEKIRQGFNQTTEILNTIMGNSMIGSVLAIFERSIDMTCAANELKNPKEMEESLISNLLITEDRSEKDEMQLAYILLKVALPCSTKLRPVSDFLFDAIMSFNHLVRAFKDEQELKTIAQNIRCVNNYAARKGIIDPAIYPIDHELKSETDDEEICKELESELMQMLDEDMEDEPECQKKLVRKNIDIMLRTLLLVQLQLTPEQHKAESDRFYNSEIELIRTEGTCGLESISLMSKLTDDSSENMLIGKFRMQPFVF